MQTKQHAYNISNLFPKIITLLHSTFLSPKLEYYFNCSLEKACNFVCLPVDKKEWVWKRRQIKRVCAPQMKNSQATFCNITLLKSSNDKWLPHVTLRDKNNPIMKFCPFSGFVQLFNLHILIVPIKFVKTLDFFWFSCSIKCPTSVTSHLSHHFRSFLSFVLFLLVLSAQGSGCYSNNWSISESWCNTQM
jgi:hypothetical protein